MAKFSTTIFKFLSEAYIQYKKVYFWILTGLSSVASRSYLENDFEMLKKEYFNIIARYLMPQAMLSFSYYFIQLPWKGKTKTSLFFHFYFYQFSRVKIKNLFEFTMLHRPLLSATLRASSAKISNITKNTSCHKIKWFWFLGQLFFSSITKELSEYSTQFLRTKILINSHF